MNVAGQNQCGPPVTGVDSCTRGFGNDIRQRKNARNFHTSRYDGVGIHRGSVVVGEVCHSVGVDRHSTWILRVVGSGRPAAFFSSFCFSCWT